MGWILVCACALSDGGYNNFVLDNRYDYVELNTITRPLQPGDFYQLIFWNWNRRDGMPHAQSYVVLPRDGKTSLPQVKRPSLVSPYTLLFYDPAVRCMRRIRVSAITSSHTGYDPELEDRQAYPRVKRVPLVMPERPALRAAHSVLRQN